MSPELLMEVAAESIVAAILLAGYIDLRNALRHQSRQHREDRRADRDHCDKEIQRLLQVIGK